MNTICYNYSLCKFFAIFFFSEQKHSSRIHLFLLSTVWLHYRFLWVMLHACYFSLTPLMWSSKKTKNHIGITQKLVSFDLILPRSVDPAPKYRLPYSDPQGYLASFYTYMNFTSLNVSLPVIIAITRQIATIRFDMKELVQFFPPTLNKLSSL